jgi:hypothetical protein
MHFVFMMKETLIFPNGKEVREYKMTYFAPGSGLYSLLRIPKTLKVVSGCWMSAEKNLQSEVRSNFPNVDEEFITRFFHGKFAAELQETSRQRRIANAFLADLESFFPDLWGSPELRKIANGLIADVKLHGRTTERITGGDLGFVIIRPQVSHSGSSLSIRDYRRGLLCQAKLKNERGAWGHFTQNQKRVLPGRLGYLGLLLYSYEDTQRRNLHDFRWYVCSGSESMRQLEEYLKRDTFPSLVESDSIIQGVGQGKIGTDNKDILDKIVSPAGNPTLAITLSWPPGGHPGSQVYVHAKVQHQLQVQLRQRY